MTNLEALQAQLGHDLAPTLLRLDEILGDALKGLPGVTAGQDERTEAARALASVLRGAVSKTLLETSVLHREWGMRAPAVALLPRTAADLLARELADQQRGGTDALDQLLGRAGAVAVDFVGVVSPAQTPAGLSGGVVDGDIADMLIVVDPTRQRILLFEGDAIRPQPIATKCGVHLASVVVDVAAERGATVLAAGEIALRAAGRAAAAVQLLLAAEMAGGCRTVLDMSVAYAKERVQFGRPIGAFQAIQHKLAEMAMAVDALSSLVTQTAALPAAELDQRRISLVKHTANRIAHRIGFEAHQIFAGLGYMLAHPLHAYGFALTIQQALMGSSDRLRTDPCRNWATGNAP